MDLLYCHKSLVVERRGSLRRGELRKERHEKKPNIEEERERERERERNRKLDWRPETKYDEGQDVLWFGKDDHHEMWIHMKLGVVKVGWTVGPCVRQWTMIVREERMKGTKYIGIVACLLALLCPLGLMIADQALVTLHWHRKPLINLPKTELVFQKFSKQSYFSVLKVKFASRTGFLNVCKPMNTLCY